MNETMPGPEDTQPHGVPQEQQEPAQETLSNFIDEVVLVQGQLAERRKTLDALKHDGLEKEDAYREAYEEVMQLLNYFNDLKDEVDRIALISDGNPQDTRMAQGVLKLSKVAIRGIGREFRDVIDNHHLPLQEPAPVPAAPPKPEDFSAVEHEILEASQHLKALENLVDGKALIEEEKRTSILEELDRYDKLSEELRYPMLHDRATKIREKLALLENNIRKDAVRAITTARSDYEQVKATYASVSHALTQEQRRAFRGRIAQLSATMRHIEDAEYRRLFQSAPAAAVPAIAEEELIVGLASQDYFKGQAFTKAAASLAMARAASVAPVIAATISIAEPKRRGILSVIGDSLKLV